MGEIWRGRHPGQGVPVAIKVLTAEHMRSDASRRLFSDEIKAMARLHHPGVVKVFDHGILPPQAAQQTQGRLERGAPYLVMEFASQGSLKDQRGVMPWIHIRAVLLSLLDALAHSHARGVVHRDIKPGNILLSGASDLRPGLKLADFGLAHAVDRFDELSQITGTPRYMAPEQFASQWRDFGPWTDLYALGMVAWELVCGFPPYRGDMQTIAASHMAGELPDFLQRVPVPVGFQEWLLRMCQREPHLRFRRAADAAFQLALLPEPDEHFVPTESFDGVISNPTLTLDDTLLLATESTIEVPYTEVPTKDMPQPMVVRPPPLPATWKRAEPPAPPFQLLGVGLGLFGVRTIPLVDRTRERDAIWDVLTETHASRHPQVMVLQGPSGNGKSRLVQWISERAHEVGGAHVLKAVHGPIPGPADGLAPMVARHYRCVGLTRSDIQSRLDREVGWEGSSLSNEPAALTELISPAGEEAQEVVRLNSPGQRYVLIRRLITRLGRRRPVILWIDDVQWGADALAFVRTLLDDPVEAPAILLLTVQEEALVHRPDEKRQLEQILAKPAAHRIDIDALSTADRRELVRVLLGLEGGLAEQLAARAGGNPLFTIQLVEDWVSRGMLVPGGKGFELRPGAEADLPDTLHEVWTGRLARVLEDQPPAARRCLLIAAALGQEVRESEWRAICKGSQSPVPSDLVEALMKNRLAEPTDGGWSFAHGMLRESLQRLATESGQWATINLACAEAIASWRGPSHHARLGRHLLAAGKTAHADRHLRLAAAKALEEGDDAREARALLALAEDALRRLAPAADDSRWGEIWLLRARIHASLMELDEAVREATRTRSTAKRYSWDALMPRAIAQLADVEKGRGNLAEAEFLYDRALPLFEAIGNRRRIAHCLVSLCHTHILGGDAAAARAPLDRAHALYQALGDFNGMARCLRFSGDIARLDCAWEEARDLFLASNEMHIRTGDRPNASSARHGVAEMDRLLGNLEAAEAGYREVLALNEARGVYGAIPRLNLALCQIARGNYPQARSQLTELLTLWQSQRKRGFVALCLVALMPVDAGVEDWIGFDQHLEEAVALIAQTGMVDIDVGQCAETAAQLAEEAQHMERARRAYRLALRNWEHLGNLERIEAVTHALDRISG